MYKVIKTVPEVLIPLPEGCYAIQVNPNYNIRTQKMEVYVLAYLPDENTDAPSPIEGLPEPVGAPLVRLNGLP